MREPNYLRLEIYWIFNHNIWITRFERIIVYSTIILYIPVYLVQQNINILTTENERDSIINHTTKNLVNK